MSASRTAVVLLNWNGWRDTVECMQSLLQSQPDVPYIIVCDNASTDESWQRLNAWCGQNVPDVFTACYAESQPVLKQITLIQTGSNLGFAGGCNVGIRFALQFTGCDYVWLLNNDTVVQENALDRQVNAMQSDESIGLLGSTVVYYDRPDLVQCFGGYGFNFWTARVRPFQIESDRNHPLSVAYVEQRMRYVSGASTFASRRFLETVGLLNEQYFLYFEEIDWAVRGRSFRLSYCPESIVFHKEGRSIGSSRAVSARSEQSERWLSRNRILFTKTYFPARTPIVVVWMLCVALVRACRGRWRPVLALLQGAWQGCRTPPRKGGTNKA